MRRIARLERSIDLVKVRTSSHSTSSYLCSACRHRAAPFSTSTIRSAKVSYTEKIRKKLWGTDKPPGQADPYGNESVFNQTKKREEEERLEEEEERRKGSTAPVVDSSSYEQATTWGDNEQGRVPWVGGFGGWWAKNWDPENQFSGFLPQSKNIMKDPNQIRAALHRALVEVYASKQAGLPLDIPRATTWVPSQRIQIRPTETGVELDFSQATSQEAFMKSLEKIDETAVHEVPTESEEDVAADRSTVDPLHPDSTPAPVEETSVHENPTESEEDIVADRSASRGKVYKNERRGYKYENFARSSYPIWSQVPLTDPEIKFAVSCISLFHIHGY